MTEKNGYPLGVIFADKDKNKGAVIFTRSELIINPATVISVRLSGEFEGKALYLDPVYKWCIIEDSEGVNCLVPSRRIK